MKLSILMLLVFALTTLSVGGQPYKVRIDNNGIPTLEKIKPAPPWQGIPVPATQQPDVIIKLGTAITLQLQNNIDLRYVRNGEIIPFLVIMDVVVEGQVVIPTNAIGLGRTRVYPARANMPSRVQIDLYQVQCITGEQINLNGTFGNLRFTQNY